MASILSTHRKKNSPCPRNTTHSKTRGLTLLVTLDHQHVVTTATADPFGGLHLGVHGVSGYHDPVQVEGVKQVPQGRDLVGLVRRWVSTAPVAWSKAARRCGAGSSLVRAPRMVLPSTAITLRPLMVPVRVHHHDARWVSRFAGSRSCSTRRMVDCRGQGLTCLQSQGLQLGSGQVGGVLPYCYQAAPGRPVSRSRLGTGPWASRSARPAGPWDRPHS